jgi:hypothetical protein
MMLQPGACNCTADRSLGSPPLYRAVLLRGALAGASAPSARPANVTVLGVPNARFWPDTQGRSPRESDAGSERGRRRRTANTHRSRLPCVFFSNLGGGDDGALGRLLVAGPMVARTSFKLVTGVSTCAMITSFPLGPTASFAYDVRCSITPLTLQRIGGCSAIFGKRWPIRRRFLGYLALCRSEMSPDISRANTHKGVCC